MYLNIPVFEKKNKHNDLSIKDKDKYSMENIDNNNLNNSNIYSYNNRNYSYLLSKIVNDSSKLYSVNNKSSIIGKNNQDNEVLIYNYNENNNIRKFNNLPKKKINLMSIPKQQKLLLFEQNKNSTPRLNIKIRSKIKERRNNKFISVENRDALGKISNNSNNNKTNNEENDKNKNNSNKLLSGKNSNSKKKSIEKKTPKKIGINSCKFREKHRKNKDEFESKINYYEILPSIFTDRNSSKVDINSNNNKEANKSMLLRNVSVVLKDLTKKKILANDIKNNVDKMTLESLSGNDRAYFILCHSQILNLCERIIFARASEKLRDFVSKKEILKSYELFIKNKIEEYEEKINNYNKIIETPFSPTKIAAMSLNFITREEEYDFKNFILHNYNIDENEKKYYYDYIHLFFILLGEHYNERCPNENVNKIFGFLQKQGFANLKDYLYNYFILQKFKDELNNERKIDQFIELFKTLPDLIKYNGDIKTSKFITFSYFLLFEVNNYWIKIKEHIQIKNKTQHYIDSLKEKIDLMNQ